MPTSEKQKAANRRNAKKSTAGWPGRSSGLLYRSLVGQEPLALLPNAAEPPRGSALLI